MQQEIQETIQSIRYNEDNIHTTLATFQVSDNFTFHNTFLGNITNIVCTNLPLAKNVRIEYNEWIVNQDSEIVCGNPNHAFFEDAEK